MPKHDPVRIDPDVVNNPDSLDAIATKLNVAFLALEEAKDHGLLSVDGILNDIDKQYATIVTRLRLLTSPNDSPSPS